VLISLGGFTWSRFLSNAALTPESRRQFARSCIDLYVKGNLPRLADDPSAGGEGAGAGVFDGIDIDWEYPAAEGAAGNVVRPEDTRNFTLLLAELRRQDAGPHHGSRAGRAQRIARRLRIVPGHRYVEEGTTNASPLEGGRCRST